MPPPGGNGGVNDSSGWLDEPLTEFEVKFRIKNILFLAIYIIQYLKIQDLVAFMSQPY